jgi:hypothetical protein
MIDDKRGREKTRSGFDRHFLRYRVGMLLVAGAAWAEPKPSCDAEREVARTILTKHCGECHVGSRKTAKPKALKVFDLDDPDFPSRMSQRQLRNANGRIEGAGAGGDEKAAFKQFIDTELARRGKSEP